MKYGYARNDDRCENIEEQIHYLKSIRVDDIFSDSGSGTVSGFQNFCEMMSRVNCGDTVYVYSFSVLAKSAGEFIDVVSDIVRKGVTVAVCKENFTTNHMSWKAIAEFLNMVKDEFHKNK